MNKYTSLAKNTAIFAIGTFGSKILSFIMVFFYSRALLTSEFGLLDIIINSGSLLLPIAMLGITNSIVRFGLDDDYSQTDVFTTGLVAVGVGFGALLVFCPLIALVEDLRPYLVILYAHVLMSALRHICSYFVRSNNQVKLFAADSIFSTFTTCLLTFVFLIPLKMGIIGYLLAIVLADFCSVLFLCVKGNIFSYINFKTRDRAITRQMIRFALPMMPNSILWWVVNVSDRYFVNYMLGSSANGLYAVAYKVPTILTIVSNVFLDAWQISAVTENKDKSHAKFYSEIFKSFQGAIFVVGAFFIVTAKLITKILLAESYYDSWQFIPTLIFATVFSCFVVFLGNIYLAEKKNVASLITTLCGAALNLILNGPFIKLWGAQGAAIATCLSYFLVFLVRAIHLNFINREMNFSCILVSLNTIVMLVQTFIMITELPYWILWQALCILVLLIINYKALFEIVKKVLNRKKG